MSVVTNRPFSSSRSITHSYMTLFWSLFGLTQLKAVREGHMQPFTRRVGEYLLMAYHALAIIVLINMLIAMMSNSFQNIEVRTTPGEKTVLFMFTFCLCFVLSIFCMLFSFFSLAPQ